MDRKVADPSLILQAQPLFTHPDPQPCSPSHPCAQCPRGTDPGCTKALLCLLTSANSEPTASHGDQPLISFMTMVLIFLHTFWGILFFHGCENRHWWEIVAVVVMHLAVSGSTFCNPLYVGSLVPSYVLMAIAAVWAYMLSGGSVQNLRRRDSRVWVIASLRKLI
uniref:Gamma-secretase subunit APH-1 n=1 Tax=Meleagris gallopavo TaxID=9103 RepID=A0A803YIG9_MELGA